MTDGQVYLDATLATQGQLRPLTWGSLFPESGGTRSLTS